MCALYAYLRQTDDIADAPGELGDKADALARWRDELHQALAGQLPADLARLDRPGRHRRPARDPRRYLAEVIDGVALDLDPQPFATFADLDAYCYRVASVVGLSCLHIWGFRSERGAAERLAEACGVALQLTNIIRDVREDALNGRVYLPTEDLAGSASIPVSSPPRSPRTGSGPSSNSKPGARPSYYQEAAGTRPAGRPRAARSCWRSSVSTAASSTRSSAATTTSSPGGSRSPPGGRSGSPSGRSGGGSSRRVRPATP